jgi:hypothetical protein
MTELTTLKTRVKTNDPQKSTTAKTRPAEPKESACSPRSFNNKSCRGHIQLQVDTDLGTASHANAVDLSGEICLSETQTSAFYHSIPSPDASGEVLFRAQMSNSGNGADRPRGGWTMDKNPKNSDLDQIKMF